MSAESWLVAGNRLLARVGVTVVQLLCNNVTYCARHVDRKSQSGVLCSVPLSGLYNNKLSLLSSGTLCLQHPQLYNTNSQTFIAPCFVLKIHIQFCVLQDIYLEKVAALHQTPSVYHHGNILLYDLQQQSQLCDDITKQAVSCRQVISTTAAALKAITT